MMTNAHSEKLIAEQDSLETRLREACVDWNGEQISDNSTPRYEISCGTIREAADTLSQMRDALEVCRDKFAEYVRLHKAKLHDGTPTQEWLSIRGKVTRNEDMVRLCEAALTTTKIENGVDP